ncbi:MAG: TRAP transporter large permease subunit [Methylococcales bacterium]|nr:TRAP transporter large permease subunit [Methylococcales bacterium]
MPKATINLNGFYKLRSGREWFSTLPVFLLLISVIIAGNGEQIHARLLNVGELIWHDYFTLRADISTPPCDPDFDIEAALQKLEAENDDMEGMDDLFDAEPFDRKSALSSLQNVRQLCITKHQLAQQNQARITLPVILFRTLETGVAKISLFAFEKQRMILILTIFICAVTSTLKQQHIAFRPVITLKDHRISTIAQLFGNSAMLASAWFYRDNVYQSATVIEHSEIYFCLILGFAVLTTVSFFQLFKTLFSQDLYKAGESTLHAILSIPLYVLMTFFVCVYFFLIEGHWAGPAIFFSLLFDQAGLFLNIGLYIWVGMLLKQTQLGDLVFKVFIPWRMSPELLAFVAIVVMAVPTAYTGASGIIIIAMGAIVYEELRRAGARRQLALAATAMTGSAGVVLRPCLLVVLIAALNKEVVTDQLFSWGLKTFMTTAVVFFVFTLMTKREKIHLAPFNEAFKPFLRALIPLFPYVLIAVLIFLAYFFLLNVTMDEFSAPVILPVVILGLIIYEKLFVRIVQIVSLEERSHKFEYTIRMASSESSVHIGALLLLMGLSFVLGGVIERSGLLNNIPDDFSSIWVTLSFLIVVLVGIGMIMDPFGAVVLVSGTIAQIAYNNGINPVHFWMITLVSFELGYLTPPVALNHLLTRQMVGYQETALAGLEGDNFWYRHEKILLPLVTMGTTLLLVTIVPVLAG